MDLKPKMKLNLLHKRIIIPCEYLSPDIFEDDFIKIIADFLVLLKVVSVSRVEARDRFVTPPTLKLKLYTVLHMILVLYSYTYTHFTYCAEHYPSEDLKKVIVTAYWITAVNFFTYVLYARFCYNQDNVKFFIELQKIDRLMNVEHNKHINYMLQRVFNITLWSIVGSSVFIWLGSFGGGFLMMWTFASYLAALGPAMFDLAFMSTFMLYFRIRVRYINAIMLNYIEGVRFIEKPPNLCVSTIEALRYLATITHDFRDIDSDVHLERLFKLFTFYEKLNALPLVINYVSLFGYSVVFVYLTSHGFTNNGLSIKDWMIITGSLGLAWVQSSTILLRYVLFTREVIVLKQTCVIVMSLCFEGPQRRKAKRMYKLIHELPPRLSVFGMWHMDTEFYLNLLNAISAWTVTVLQFVLDL